MPITERIEIPEGMEREDVLNHILLTHEMLRLNCNRLLAIVKRAANNSCCICCDECLSCDAKELLRELDEIK